MKLTMKIIIMAAIVKYDNNIHVSFIRFFSKEYNYS